VIRIDENEGVAVQLRVLYEHMQSELRAMREAKASCDVPSYSFEDMIESVLHAGIESLYLGRGPNSVVALNPYDRDRQYKKGDVLQLPTCNLYIGAEIMLMEASKKDAPNWDVQQITFGNLYVVNDIVPLSSVRYLTRWDLLGPFLHMKTKVDVPVNVRLICKTDGSTFDGYRIYAFLEEQNLYVQSRIERSDESCPHLDEDVELITYTDKPDPYRWQGSPSFTHHSMTVPMHQGVQEIPKRFFCRRCRREVSKLP